MTSSQAILVLGMHRSGTSVLSGTLHLLGVPLGDSLIPADPVNNAKGYWEHSVISDLNERILRKLGSSWVDESPLAERWWLDEAIVPLRKELVQTLKDNFEDCPLWAVKDPRICRLLPLWLGVLEEIGCQPVFILIARDPVETAASLERRNGIHAWKSYLLWLRYILEGEMYTRRYRRTFLTYEQLLGNWEPLLSSISNDLAVDWPVPVATARDEIARFIDDGLRHNNVAVIMLRSDTYLDLARTAYEAMQEGLATLSAAQPRLLADLDEVVARNQICLNQINECLMKIESDTQQIVTLKTIVRSLEQEIYRIKSTVSWRVTKPLRFVANLLHKMLS